MAKGNEILFKISHKTKALWSKAADIENLTLKAWIIKTLNDDFEFTLQTNISANSETSTVIRINVGYTQKSYWLYQSKLAETKLIIWIASKLNRAAAISRYMKKNGY